MKGGSEPLELWPTGAPRTAPQIPAGDPARQPRPFPATLTFCSSADAASGTSADIVLPLRASREDGGRRCPLPTSGSASEVAAATDAATCDLAAFAAPQPGQLVPPAARPRSTSSSLQRPRRTLASLPLRTAPLPPGGPSHPVQAASHPPGIASHLARESVISGEGQAHIRPGFAAHPVAAASRTPKLPGNCSSRAAPPILPILCFLSWEPLFPRHQSPRVPLSLPAPPRPPRPLRTSPSSVTA